VVRIPEEDLMAAATVSRYYATGKRKNSIARVWMMPGTGKVTINDKPMEQYFGRDVLKMIIRQPFEVTGTQDKFDVLVSVLGGGNSGQAGAIRHGISKALLAVDAESRGKLRKEGLLTRDPRAKERKKYGQKGARARFQFSKR
jgi:small subunit ribosomal protein S9